VTAWRTLVDFVMYLRLLNFSTYTKHPVTRRYIFPSNADSSLYGITSNVIIWFTLKRLFYIGDRMTRYSEFNGMKHFPDQIPSQVYVAYLLICYIRFQIYDLRRYFELC
jgi:hypothetical protein